jgi:hypothetical protein
LVAEVAKLQSRVLELEQSLDLPPLKFKQNLIHKDDSALTLQESAVNLLEVDWQKRYKKLARQFEEVSEQVSEAQWGLESREQEWTIRLHELNDLVARLQADLHESEVYRDQVSELLESAQTQNLDVSNRLNKTQGDAIRFSKAVQVVHERLKRDMLRMVAFLDKQFLTVSEMAPLLQGFLHNAMLMLSSEDGLPLDLDMDDEPGFMDRVESQWVSPENGMSMEKDLVEPIEVEDSQAELKELRWKLGVLDEEKHKLSQQLHHTTLQLGQRQSEAEKRVSWEVAVHQVTRGTEMLKYNRNGKNPQTRFVWINCASKTLHWSSSLATVGVQKSKHVKIVSHEFNQLTHELLIMSPSRTVLLKLPMSALGPWLTVLADQQVVSE